MQTLNKIISVFFLLMIVFISGQNTRFIYEYNYIPDSTDTKNKMMEIMFLDIYKDKSEFFSNEKYVVDSMRQEASKKGIFFMPPPNMNVSYKIVKNNLNEVFYINNELELGTLVVQDFRELKWTVLNEKKNILNYPVQKASAFFAGRKWFAWFTANVPLNNGPYKFKGLPGLILEIQDDQNYHSFKLIGVKKLPKNYSYPENEERTIKMSYEEYRKNFSIYRSDPAATIRMKYNSGKIPNQRDHNGNPVSGMDVVKRVEKALKEKISKNNNIIERDLIISKDK